MLLDPARQLWVAHGGLGDDGGAGDPAVAGQVVAAHDREYYKGDLFEAVVRACKDMEGAYGLGVISSDEPEKMVAVRKDSPLIVGLSENGNFIASDIPALLKHTRDIYLLENNETVVLSRNSVEIFDKDLNPAFFFRPVGSMVGGNEIGRAHV